MFETPILLLIFNRPDTTKKVFDRIRDIKPRYLYVAADGARDDRPDEKDLCSQTRDIVSKIDWECNLKTLFRDKNLGCKKAVTEAINWLFQNVERGIILEDDCLPSESFFYFCEELLEYHKDNERIMHIGGNNFQFGANKTKDSYYYSIYNHIWGWATWKRAWLKYDVDVKTLPEFIRSKKIKKSFKTKQMQNFWLNNFGKVYQNQIDTWDYQWQYCICYNNGLAITPNTNLVANIGFDERATHTKSQNNASNLAVEDIDFPLKHPTKIKKFTKADNYTFYTIFEKKVKLHEKVKKVVDRLKKIAKKILGKPV